MSGDRLRGAYELKNYKKLAGFMHGVCYWKIPANHIIDISTQPGMIIPYLPSGNLTELLKIALIEIDGLPMKSY